MIFNINSRHVAGVTGAAMLSFSKVKFIFNAYLDAKKRLNFPLGTSFLYKILAPQVEGNGRFCSPQVNVSSYLDDKWMTNFKYK